MRRLQSTLMYSPSGKMFIPDYQNYGDDPHVMVKFIFITKKIKRSVVWSTLDIVIHFFNTLLVNVSFNKTNKPTNQDEFGLDYTVEEPSSQSDFEKNITELVKKEIVTEEYAQDIFKQEQIFKDCAEELLEDQTNNEILVCGDKIFTGTTFEEVLKKARSEFPKRPYYSFSTKTESFFL